MPRTKKLSRFTAEPAREDFTLTIEDESGGTLQLMASREQIELIADTLDDLLSEDDDADLVNGASEDDED